MADNNTDQEQLKTYLKDIGEGVYKKLRNDGFPHESAVFEVNKVLHEFEKDFIKQNLAQSFLYEEAKMKAITSALEKEISKNLNNQNAKAPVLDQNSNSATTSTPSAGKAWDEIFNEKKTGNPDTEIIQDEVLKKQVENAQKDTNRKEDEIDQNIETKKSSGAISKGSVNNEDDNETESSDEKPSSNNSRTSKRSENQENSESQKEGQKYNPNEHFSSDGEAKGNGGNESTAEQSSQKNFETSRNPSRANSQRNSNSGNSQNQEKNQPNESSAVIPGNSSKNQNQESGGNQANSSNQGINQELADLKNNQGKPGTPEEFENLEKDSSSNLPETSIGSLASGKRGEADATRIEAENLRKSASGENKPEIDNELADLKNNPGTSGTQEEFDKLGQDSSLQNSNLSPEQKLKKSKELDESAQKAYKQSSVYENRRAETGKETAKPSASVGSRKKGGPASWNSGSLYNSKGEQISPGIKGTSDRDVAATAAKLAKNTTGRIGSGVGSIGKGIESGGQKLQNFGNQLKPNENKPEEKQNIADKAKGFVGDKLGAAGQNISNVGQAISEAGDKLKDEGKKLIARGVIALWPIISFILIVALIAVTIVIVIFVFCEQLRKLPAGELIARGFGGGEIVKICEGFGVKLCAIEEGGVSGGAPICLDKQLEGKSDNDKVSLYKAQNGISTVQIPVYKVKRVIDAGKQAGVDSQVIAWVLSLASTESDFEFDIYDGGEQCYGIIQFCRSDNADRTYQLLSNQVFGEDVSGEVLRKNPVMQMKMAEAGYRLKLKENRALSKFNGKSDIYVAAYRWLGEGCDKYGTCTKDYGEAADKNYAIITCQQGQDTQTSPVKATFNPFGSLEVEAVEDILSIKVDKVANTSLTSEEKAFLDVIAVKEEGNYNGSVTAGNKGKYQIADSDVAEALTALKKAGYGGIDNINVGNWMQPANQDMIAIGRVLRNAQIKSDSRKLSEILKNSDGFTKALGYASMEFQALPAVPGYAHSGGAEVGNGLTIDVASKYYQKVLGEYGGTSSDISQASSSSNCNCNQSSSDVSYLDEQDDSFLGFKFATGDEAENIAFEQLLGSVKAEAVTDPDVAKFREYVSSGKIPVALSGKSRFLEDFDGSQGIDKNVAKLMVNWSEKHTVRMTALGNRTHGLSGGDHNKSPVQGVDIDMFDNIKIENNPGEMSTEQLKKMADLLNEGLATGVVNTYLASTIIKNDMKKVGFTNFGSYNDGPGHIHVSIKTDASFSSSGGGSGNNSNSSNCGSCVDPTSASSGINNTQTQSSSSTSLDEIAKKYGLQSLGLQELGTNNIKDYNGNQAPTYGPASTAKVVVVVTLDQIKKGKFSLNDTITIPNSILDSSGGKNTWTVKEAIDLALRNSDNTAANTLMYKLANNSTNISSLDGQIQSLGYSSTKLPNFFNIKGAEAKTASEGGNTSNVIDISSAMNSLYSGNSEGHKIAQSALRNSNEKWGINSEANKWGLTSKVTGNTAIMAVDGKKYIVTGYVNSGNGGNNLKQATEEVVNKIKSKELSFENDLKPSFNTLAKNNLNEEQSNFFDQLLGNIQVEAAYGTKPSKYSELTPAHKAFLAEIAKEKGYVAYPDKGGENSNMRKALNDMINAAKKDDVNLIYNNSYRGYDYQIKLYFGTGNITNPITKYFSDTLTTSEKAEVKKQYLARSDASAPPGFSEHSTGLAVDFQTVEGELSNNFDKEAGYSWLKTNAAKYGFINSYPQNSSAGAKYESWHWRWDGSTDYPNPNPVSNLGGSSSSTPNTGSGNCSNNSNLTGGNLTLLEYAKKQSKISNSSGYCETAIEDYVDAVGFGKWGGKNGKMPDFPEAHDSADALNANNGALAKSLGIKNLLWTNKNLTPYDAPAGSIVVVSASSPGTCNATAGDISVAGGDGTFYNDHPTQNYKGKGCWNGPQSLGASKPECRTNCSKNPGKYGGTLLGIFVEEK